jgi:hypothetical protein
VATAHHPTLHVIMAWLLKESTAYFAGFAAQFPFNARNTQMCSKSCNIPLFGRSRMPDLWQYDLLGLFTAKLRDRAGPKIRICSRPLEPTPGGPYPDPSMYLACFPTGPGFAVPWQKQADPVTAFDVIGPSADGLEFGAEIQIGRITADQQAFTLVQEAGQPVLKAGIPDDPGARWVLEHGDPADGDRAEVYDGDYVKIRNVGSQQYIGFYDHDRTGRTFGVGLGNPLVQLR